MTDHERVREIENEIDSAIARGVKKIDKALQHLS
jgi:hypothetical protein